MPDFSSPCPNCGAGVFDIDVSCGACGAKLASTGAQRMIGSVVLGDYEILDVLGQGGMSVVYKGRHRVTGQDVALKVLPPELAAHSAVKSRFLEEARALARLDHPNIVHLYNFGEEGGCFVLAMQLVQGQTFERMILEAGRLEWRQACAITRDVIAALDYAHRRGIVHRDMKPSNVLVRADDGAATVMDFGIAKVTTSSSRLTATGQTMGTVRYMAPEQVRGREVDARTDIYAVAISLYEAICGDTPFDGETHFDIMSKQLTDAPPPPSSMGVELPPRLEQALLLCLAKNPEERPAKVAALGEIIDEVLAEAPVVAGTGQGAGAVSAKPTAPPLEGDGAMAGDPLLARRGRSLLWAGVLSAAVAAAAITVLVFGGGGDSEAKAGEAHAQAPAAADGHAKDTAFPEPFLVPDLAYQVDRTFITPPVRVLAVEALAKDEVLTAYERATAEFVAFLHGRGLAAKDLALPPINVVLVPRRVLCDRRIYERQSDWDRCADNQFWYRPMESTLFLAHDAGWQDQLGYAAALHVCLQSTISGCDDALAERSRGGRN